MTVTLHRAAARFRPGRTVTTAVLLLLLAVMLAYFLLPLAWVVISATKTNSDLFGTFGLAFGSQNALWENLANVFTFGDGVFIRWLGNTAFYSVTAAVGSALVSALAGYAFAKYTFAGRSVLFAGIIIAVIVPITVLVLPLFLLLSAMGLINTPWAMILPSIASPFGVYLMWIFAKEALPTDILEAARIDGAGEFTTFFRVALPLLMPGFVTVLLFAFVATWNNYFLPLLVFNKPDLYPLTVGLALWNESVGSPGSGATYVTYATVVTGALVAILPLVLAFLLLQRYWRSGLTFGSLKG
jgi:multiple sugar transport system permease protein